MSLDQFVGLMLLVSAAIMAASVALLVRARARTPLGWTFWYSWGMGVACIVLAIVYLRH